MLDIHKRFPGFHNFTNFGYFLNYELDKIKQDIYDSFFQYGNNILDIYIILLIKNCTV